MPVLTCRELFCGGGWIANLLDVLTPLWAADLRVREFPQRSRDRG